MPRPLILAIAVLVILGRPAPAHAWGFEAHQFIMGRAIALLPQEIRPFFERHRAAVVERSIDPDLWRKAGGENEEPNHFLDYDWEGYGKYPFAELPRDYTSAIAKFGRTRILENGTLPWRTEEMYGELRRAFESYSRRGPFGRFDIIHFSAWLAHYVGDAHQPFHNVLNYDGQLSGQRGIHVRFEAFLFERYSSQLAITAKPLPAIGNPRDFIFDTAREGTQMVPVLLKADLDAIGAREVYDDAYYAAFFKASRPILERRVNDSIAAIAAMITGAWEAAGKPPLALDLPEPAQPRRRP